MQVTRTNKKNLGKDKTTGKRTMLDQMKEEGFDPKKANHDPKKAQIQRMEQQIQVSMYTPEYAQSIIEYNQRATTLDEKYKNLTMTNGILVRCFLYEVEKSEAGLITPFQATIQVEGRSGMPSNRTVEVNAPYSVKAVIVSAPENYKLLTPGTLVQLRENAIRNRVVGDFKGGFQLDVENAFMLVDNYKKEFTTDVTSPDYGYVVIQYSDIVCFL